MRLIWLALAFTSLGKSVTIMEEATCTHDNRQCRTTSAETFGQGRLVNELIMWIKENGGIIDDRQVVRKDGDSTHNVYATAFIPEGTVLLSVPWDIVLAHENPEESGLCETVQVLREELEEYKQGNSSFGPYIRYLKSLTNPMMIPSGWSKAGQDLLMTVLGENLPPHSLARDGLLNVEWWEEDCEGDLEGMETVRDALLLVTGYRCGLSAPSEDDEDWFDSMYAMLPFYDIYSHRDGDWFNTNLSQAVASGDVVITASRDINAGEPIHISKDFGTPIGTAIHFLESGLVKRLPQRYSFTFHDDSAGSDNQEIVVEFDLDEAEDEDGDPVPVVTWVNDIHAPSRSFGFMDTELTRLIYLLEFLTVDATYLEVVPRHERKAIFEYASALIYALSAAIEARYEPMPITEWTILDYEVAGVNLGTYNLIGKDEVAATNVEPYELFEDFDIGHLIKGDEGWKDLIEYRRSLDRPSISFYVDKVARKRWLPIKGISQAKQYVLKYDFELTEKGDVNDETRALFELIPNQTDYAAKPSHHSEGSGVWLVSYDRENNVTSFSSTARQLKQDDGKVFDKLELTMALARNLHLKARDGESNALKRVKPGVVVEERMVEVDHYHRAPVEFCMFVIWGKVWVGQICFIEGEGRYSGRWMYRNGTLAGGDGANHLDYIDWLRVVEIAEMLGANKDMFRVDIFVGLPAGSPTLWVDARRRERLEAVEYFVNECEIYPTTNFRDWQQLAQDGARLWVAGYKRGNYVTVPNTEVPKEFLETGLLLGL